MLHRHLNHQELTLAAIDDLIARGKRRDWVELRRAVLTDQKVLEKVLRVCHAHVTDPYDQRYHFWLHYAERHWGLVLSAAAHLQCLLPEAVLVGGTASVLYALRSRFDVVLADLEAVVGWKTARIQRPAQILGSLDGIETGIRQLIWNDPLETVQITCFGKTVTVPTPAEMLRIKGILILRRNATRDYLDFVALANYLEDNQVVEALQRFDQLYPQSNEESALQQLQVQLANPLPYDLEEINLTEYKNLAARWHDWSQVKSACIECAVLIFDQIVGLKDQTNE